MEVKASTSPPLYRSGQVELDLARRELRVGGVPVPIGGRALEIIEVLVRAAGELVTTDQLMERVWAGAIVEDNTLQVHISAVRKALGPDRGILKNVKGRGYRLLGSWQLSGGAEPVGEVVAAAPAGSASSNLPSAGTDLIGRELAIQELQDLLSAYRVITLSGPGGIGKSRLALETARQMAAQGSGDVCLVELASLSDPGQFSFVVASTLHLGLGFGDVSAEAVARSIGQKKILLLLDNCEHVIDPAAMFAETIVRLCPQVTILATSREVFRIDGEHVYRVPPLEVPDQQDMPGDILSYSAAQLFVARVFALDSAFAPATNLPDIAVICQRLDGIPLAIEFAAARAAMLGVSQVATDLDNRLSLLMAGRRTTLARHQTLRAALDWSYDLLSASEQQLLRHVSIFPAGFTLEAATAVTSHTHDAAAVVDGIASLVGKSLLTLDVSASGGRWRLLGTIRAYAFEKLRDSGEAEHALRRQAAFFRDFLTPAGAASPLEPTPDAVVRYYREIDNIRATLDWCFSPTGDTSIGTAITAAFLPVWLRFALGTEFRRRAENALVHLGEDPTTDAPRRMLLSIGLGITLIQIGARSGEALSAATESLRIADSLGEPLSRMYALWALWVVHAYRGNCREAGPVAEDFFRLATASGDPARLYLADRQMGISMHYGGNQPKAREHLERVADQYRRSLGRPQMAWLGHNLSEFAQSTLARVLCLQGFLDQARILAQTCIDHMQLAGEKFGLCYVLAEAACPIAILVNDTDEAERHVAHFINAATALDLRYWITLARCLEGVVLVKKGNYEAGVAALRAALAVCDEIGGMTRYPTFLGTLAGGLAGLGRTDEARTTLDQALARADRDGEAWCIPNLLCLKGELAVSDAGPSSAHAARAEQCFRDAIALAHRQGALLWELRGAWHLACLRLEQKRPDDAGQILAPVYSRFVEGFETPALRAAKLLLDSVETGRSEQ